TWNGAAPSAVSSTGWKSFSSSTPPTASSHSNSARRIDWSTRSGPAPILWERRHSRQKRNGRRFTRFGTKGILGQVHPLRGGVRWRQTRTQDGPSGPSASSDGPAVLHAQRLANSAHN